MNKVITIWENAEFGCELAYRIAKETGKNILLIDMDLLSPKIDLYLNVSKEAVKIREKKPGLDVLVEWSNRKYLNSEIIRKASVHRSELKNLFIITGSYNIENFEYYTKENIEDIINKARQSFEITILLVNKFIYDAYTLIALLLSDLNIVATEPNTINLREFNNYLMFLNEKQGLELDKTKFVAYEYIPGLHQTINEMKEITDDNFLGSIRYSRSRVACRSKNKCYAKTMDKTVREDYLKIITKLQITPKIKFTDKVKGWFKTVNIKGGRYKNANSYDT